MEGERKAHCWRSRSESYRPKVGARRTTQALWGLTPNSPSPVGSKYESPGRHATRRGS